jgi:hypothetical protein
MSHAEALIGLRIFFQRVWRGYRTEVGSGARLGSFGLGRDTPTGPNVGQAPIEHRPGAEIECGN